VGARQRHDPPAGSRRLRERDTDLPGGPDHLDTLDALEHLHPALDLAGLRRLITKPFNEALDLGDPAAAKYDIEVWLPGQEGGKGQYRETHSTSNTTDYQARRLNVRYKSNVNGQMSNVGFAYMLNGTCFAIGRILIAIIENYQTKNGTVKVPKVLRKYLNFKEIKR
jgi:seryl-tRNA synthetase